MHMVLMGFFSPEKQADSCALQLCGFCPSAFLYQGMKMERVLLKLLFFSISFFFHLPHYYPEIKATTSWVGVEHPRESLNVVDKR